MLYEILTLQSKAVCTFLEDLFIAKWEKVDRKADSIFFFRRFYCCCSADGPKVSASLPVTMTQWLRKRFGYGSRCTNGKKPYRREVFTGAGDPETLEIFKSHQDTALGNLLQVVLVEHGIGPDDFLRSLPTSTIPQL